MHHGKRQADVFRLKSHHIILIFTVENTDSQQLFKLKDFSFRSTTITTKTEYNMSHSGKNVQNLYCFFLLPLDDTDLVVV